MRKSYRDTQVTHTGYTGAHGHTDHTGEPHNHPNPPKHPHDRATTESAADSTRRAQHPHLPQPRSRTLPAADSEEAAPSEPGPAASRSQSASPRLLEGGESAHRNRIRTNFRLPQLDGQSLPQSPYP